MNKQTFKKGDRIKFFVVENMVNKGVISFFSDGLVKGTMATGKLFVKVRGVAMEVDPENALLTHEDTEPLLQRLTKLQNQYRTRRSE